MSKRSKRHSIFTYLLPIVFVYILVTAAYTVITGESLYDSSTQITTFGRVTTGFFAVVFLAYMLWAIRDLRSLRSELARKQEDRDE
jgi:hypothetical protein